MEEMLGEPGEGLLQAQSKETGFQELIHRMLFSMF